MYLKKTPNLFTPAICKALILHHESQWEPHLSSMNVGLSSQKLEAVKT